MQNSSLFVAFAIMLVIYYFLLIRPQQQRIKRHKEMVNNLKKGDRILTQGGIFGKVTKLGADDSNEIEVEIAAGVKVNMLRSTIQNVVSRTEPQA